MTRLPCPPVVRPGLFVMETRRAGRPVSWTCAVTAVNRPQRPQRRQRPIENGETAEFVTSSAAGQRWLKARDRLVSIGPGGQVGIKHKGQQTYPPGIRYATMKLEELATGTRQSSFRRRRGTAGWMAALALATAVVKPVMQLVRRHNCRSRQILPRISKTRPGQTLAWLAVVGVSPPLRNIGQSCHGGSFAPSCALDDGAGGARQQEQQRQCQQFQKQHDNRGVGRVGGAAHVPCQQFRDGEHQEQRHQAHAA